MAELPPDRVEIGPPFTNVGFDVFKPWTVQTRRTRGVAVNKRWGVVFTCLVSRAIHIALLETMDARSFSMCPKTVLLHSITGLEG